MLVLNPTLSDNNLATLTLLWVSAQDDIFCSRTFNLFVYGFLKFFFYRKHIVEPCFFNFQFNNFYLLFGMFRQFTLNVIIHVAGFKLPSCCWILVALSVPYSIFFLSFSFLLDNFFSVLLYCHFGLLVIPICFCFLVFWLLKCTEYTFDLF